MFLAPPKGPVSQFLVFFNSVFSYLYFPSGKIPFMRDRGYISGQFFSIYTLSTHLSLSRLAIAGKSQKILLNSSGYILITKGGLLCFKGHNQID